MTYRSLGLTIIMLCWTGKYLGDFRLRRIWRQGFRVRYPFVCKSQGCVASWRFSRKARLTWGGERIILKEIIMKEKKRKEKRKGIGQGARDTQKK